MTGMPFSCGIGLELRQHLDAVHHRHGDVEEDEIGRFLGGDREAFDAVAGLEDFAVVGLEGFPDDDADGLGIVDGENFVAHGVVEVEIQSPAFMRMSATSGGRRSRS